jgi:hypothetical protein
MQVLFFKNMKRLVISFGHACARNLLIIYILRIYVLFQAENIDGSVLPPAVENLIGSKHAFEIKAHTYYQFKQFESFNCYDVIESFVQDSEKPRCSEKSTVTDSSSSTPARRRLKKVTDIVTPQKEKELLKRPVYTSTT